MDQEHLDPNKNEAQTKQAELESSMMEQLNASLGFAAPTQAAPVKFAPAASYRPDEGWSLDDYEQRAPEDYGSYGPAPSNQAAARFNAELEFAARAGLLPAIEQVGVKTGTIWLKSEEAEETPANAFDKPLVEPFTFPQGADRTAAQATEELGAGAVKSASGDVIASAQSKPSDFDLLQINQDLGPKERDTARQVLIKTCYRPEVIYGDAKYFTPCEPEPTEDFTAEQERLFSSPELGPQLKERNVLTCAYFSSLVPKSSLAFCTYLQEHFPLGNFADQQRFNIVLLALFYKMGEGDICLNLSSLEQFYDIVAQWQETHLSAVLNIEQDDGPKGEKRSWRETQQIEGNERFLLMVKRYAPHSIAGIYEVLQRSLAVGFDPSNEPNAPLLFDQKRLYLRRYFYYEQGIVDYVAQVPELELSPKQRTKLKASLTNLFPTPPEGEHMDWQKVAAAMATTSNFTVISGGPGTGKTTTILRILLLLICLDPHNRNIQLCAPTGKAAARMGESIGNGLKEQRMQKNIAKLAPTYGLSADELIAFVPKSAVTVHSLIKVIPNQSTPIYNAEHKLSCDVLVVDEVSMLDLALFYKLLMALKPECKLILLGDKDQLASVEAGKVLGDICARLNEPGADRINAKTLNLVAELTGYTPKELLSGQIADHACLLQYSYRSKDVPEIGQLARLVNNNVCVAQAQSAGVDQQLKEQQEQAIKQGDLSAYLKVCAELGDFKPAALVEAQEQQAQEDQEHEAQLRQNLAPIYNLLEQAAHKADQNPDKPNLPALSLIELKPGAKADALCLERAKHAVKRDLKDNYAPFLKKLEDLEFAVAPEDYELLFKEMDKFRILCSNHVGELGDNKLNEAIAQEVKNTYLKPHAELQPWLKEKFFPGQIIIITKNDPVLGLVNGNVGFCAFVASEDEKKSDTEAELGTDAQPSKERVLRVFIPVGAEERNGKSVLKVNVISTLLLTNYDLGYAMSIHKSQGSEYDKVEIMLSERINRVLTKELVYTGITRAKKCVSMVTSTKALYYALEHSVERASGLTARLAELSAQSEQ
ncbi:MAG: AAA family ATPase [Anaerobiospirillum sp.]|nr:AAA family ATPase [Anaerobiospirillum sp.]